MSSTTGKHLGYISRSWTVIANSIRYALDGAPYTIHFFFGKIDDTTINNSPLGAEYLPEHIGSIYNFSASMQFDKPTCANCERQTEEGTLSTALVPLTVSLYRAALSQTFGVDVITPEEAERFLTAALTWKVTNVSRTSTNQHAVQ